MHQLLMTAEGQEGEESENGGEKSENERGANYEVCVSVNVYVFIKQQCMHEERFTWMYTHLYKI